MSLPHHHPAPRSRRPGRAAILVIATLLCSACGRAPAAAPDDEAPELATIQRLVESGVEVRKDGRLQRGGFKFLGHVAHPVLTGARVFKPALDCGPLHPKRPTLPRRCRASAPDDMPAAPFAIVQAHNNPAAKQTPRLDVARPSTTRAGAPQAGDAPLPQPTAAEVPFTAGEVPLTPREPLAENLRSVLLDTSGPPVSVGRLNQLQVTLARLYAVPPLAERTITTDRFSVPRDALLRLSIGIEEPAWWIDSAPVFFRVVVVDESTGQTQDLFRRVLDPARRAQDRRWFDADVDLSDVAGSTVRLRFVTEPADGGDRRPSLPLWGDPRLLAASAKSALPSIVLISLDTLRARSMSTYGYALETSPNISALAARGVLFERAFTTYSNTLASHMSMLTGLYPATHGVIGYGSALGDEHATLAETLRHAGFATAAFTEDALLDSRRGFRRGFSYYYENSDLSSGLGDAAGTFGHALEWAGRNADEPFFIFAHTYQVHAPYKPPAAYRGLFEEVTITPRKHQQRAYEQEIRYTDDVLQRFLDGLWKVVPERELLVIVTADHGEEFGEHGMSTHQQLYDEVMHIPLVMMWPGRIPAGRRVAVPVSLVDLPPTILDLAGVAAPPGLDGVSLVPLLESPAGTIERDVVLAEFPEASRLVERSFIARTADHKCVLSASGRSDFCFDLVRDPDERQPRGTQETVTFTRLHALAEDYRRRALAVQRRLDDVRQQAKTPHERGPAPPPMPAAPPDQEDPIGRKLRALGYVD